MANDPTSHEHAEDIRTGLSVPALRQSFMDNLHYLQVRDRTSATLNDFYTAAAYAARDRLLQRWMNTVRKVMKSDTKVICYFSAEFLIGPQLGNNLLNLGIFDLVDETLKKEKLSLHDMRLLRLHLERMRQKAEGRIPVPGRFARTGGGTGPRQRRPGTARRLFHGFAGEP